MLKKYKVITLCGSAKFKDEFIKVQKELTLKGNIVLNIELIHLPDEEFNSTITEDIKTMLGEMHKRKIDMSDEIFVINKDGYIGNSTISEIEHAKKAGKKIQYLENK